MPEPVEESPILISDAFVAELLQTPAHEQQIAWLQGQGLFSEYTVKQLFHRAAESMGSDLQVAGALADICATAAEEQGWVDLAGQASYLRAQVHAIHAEFDAALRLIESARGHFRAAGNTLAALRTDVGWMNVMRELGRCHETLVTGVSILQQVDAQVGAQSLIAARMRNNLGLCCEQLGQFDDAMSYWAAAESAFRSNSALEEACHAQNNRGLIYLKLGQAHNALTEFEAAAQVFAENELVLNLAQTNINMSQAHFMLGDPGRGLACLEEAERVAQQLRQTHPQAVLRVGAQATVQQVQADMAECDIVHLACHGLFRHDNPLFSSLQLHDGKLTAADAVRLKFNGALVTLGACESGRSEVIAGDEMLGLPRAFLGAGASSVLVSLWLVHDETTAVFMQGWYAQIQQGAPRAQALRAMQRAIKRQHSHPYFWAPFVLMGQR